MKYIHKAQDLGKALGIPPTHQTALQLLVHKAYDQLRDSPAEDISIDDINAIIAPAIETPEEAFFVCSMILSDIFEGLMNQKK